MATNKIQTGQRPRHKVAPAVTFIALRSEILFIRLIFNVGHPFEMAFQESARRL